MRAHVLGLLGAAAAALAAPAPAAEPTGEVFFHAGGYGGSAAIDADHVFGPAVSVARTAEGRWAGDVAGQDLELRQDGRALSGSGFNVVVSTSDGRTELEGLVRGRRLRVALDAKAFTGRFGACAFDLRRTGAGTFEGTTVCTPPHAPLPASSSAELRLTGTAAQAPEPQLLLALLGVLPS